MQNRMLRLPILLSVTTLLACGGPLACGGAADSNENGSSDGEQQNSNDDEQKGKRDTDALEFVGGVKIPEETTSGQRLAVFATSSVALVGTRESPGIGIVRQSGSNFEFEWALDGEGIKGATQLVSWKGMEQIAAVSPKGELDSDKRTLHVFDLDPQSGELSNRQDFEAPVEFNFATRQGGDVVYSVPSRENTLYVTKRDGTAFQESETMELGPSAPNESGSSQFLAASQDSKHLYATTNKKYSEDRQELLADHRLYTYGIDGDDSMPQEIDYIEHERGDIPLYQPLAMTVSPNGSYVAVGFFRIGKGQVSFFERDAASGKLQYLKTSTLPVEGEFSDDYVSPDTIAFTPDNQRLYVTAGDIPAVLVYKTALQ